MLSREEYELMFNEILEVSLTIAGNQFLEAYGRLLNLPDKISKNDVRIILQAYINSQAFLSGIRKIAYYDKKEYRDYIATWHLQEINSHLHTEES